MVKVNKFGKRQERLMGIDISRVTNRKIPDKARGLLTSEETRTKERLVTNIIRVEVPPPTGDESSRRQFIVLFREAGDDARVVYEAQNANEREEILAKLTYILGLNNDAHKVVRLGRGTAKR